ncbi:FxsB family cyclophane-forming radical SAM/SPASM peptide maturase [Amycolatopsis pigmentata]|uniref:FxsB family cyclophane-forming radical SAM/SPASM peptide maturase n=1 Tax=Amycolatopsis pigmentata TaxID=450801 RepID=A0ABW5FZQ5_9PSEU
MPGPFREFILKIHSRCDLACDHCYVYTMTDQRWRERPRTMSPEIVNSTARKIFEHARDHGLSAVHVVLHGGEPLLAGPAGVERCVTALRSSSLEVGVSVQTNGMVLDNGYLKVLRRLGVKVAVSLDGDRRAHDRHRRRRDGTGSHAAVSRALRLLSSGPHRSLFTGLLCTVDLRNDPVTTYESLLEFAPPKVDFLLPQGNWLRPPPGHEPGATPYADWLIPVFDRWCAHRPPETRVRMFEEIMAVVLGGSSAVEGFGLTEPASVVVETDGAIERSDMLTAAYEGAAATGLNVLTDSFDDALPLTIPEPRSAICAECEVFASCGGGLYAHRFGADHTFGHPSVYCADLFALITHIRGRIGRELAALRRP